MADIPATKKGGRGTSELDEVLVAGALAELNGNIAGVAKQYKVTRQSLAEYIDRRPNLKQVQQDAKEGMLDHAESALYRAVLAGEAWAVCFFLKTQGRSRGYLENAALYDLQKELAALRDQVKTYVEVAHLGRALGGTGGTPG